MKAILDAGALVAVDRRNRLIGAQLRVLQQQGTPIRVSSAVVGQVWRDGRKQANLARVLAGVGIEALGKDDGKRIGELLALSGSADIVDAHVALITDARRPRLDQRSRRHPQATARSQGFGAGPDRVRLLDPANLRFQRRVARPGISTVGSSARQIPDQGVGHVLLEQDAACRGHDLRLAEICQVRRRRRRRSRAGYAAAAAAAHTETACRRGGALAPRPDDLDSGQCLIRLRQKGETVRWQPVSPTLMARLTEHGRGGTPRRAGSCSATATGGPSPPAALTACGPASAASCRGSAPGRSACTGYHTILTWVERQFGFAVAQAYAGHEDRGRGVRSMAAMATYVRAGLPEVATALAALTGEPHPLAIAPSGAEGMERERRANGAS